MAWLASGPSVLLALMWGSSNGLRTKDWEQSVPPGALVSLEMGGLLPGGGPPGWVWCNLALSLVAFCSCEALCCPVYQHGKCPYGPHTTSLGWFRPHKVNIFRIYAPICGSQVQGD